MRYKITLQLTPNGNCSIDDVRQFLHERLANSAFEVKWGSLESKTMTPSQIKSFNSFTRFSYNLPYLGERIRTAMGLIEAHDKTGGNTHFLDDACKELRKALDSINPLAEDSGS